MSERSFLVLNVDVAPGFSAQFSLILLVCRGVRK